MSAAPQKQVHPAASALLILLALAAVQAIWWRFLIYHPATRAPAMPPSSVRPGPPAIILLGRKDVLVETYAGGPDPGDSDGPGHSARFDRPTGIALDVQSNLYVADTGNNRIRTVLPGGQTSTLAGGEAGYADGPVLQARFNAPCGVCVAPDGAVYVADTGNHCIRRIQNGQVTTVTDKPGTAAGLPAAGAPSAMIATAVAYMPGANPGLIVSDAGGRRLRKYRMDGKWESDQSLAVPPTSVVAWPQSGAAAPEGGTLSLGAQTLHNVSLESEEPMNADETRVLRLRHPIALCPLMAGWLVTDDDFGAVFYVRGGKADVLAGYASSSGPIYGDRDSDGASALFGKLSGIVSDGKRYVYVADTANNSIRRLDIAETMKQ